MAKRRKKKKKTQGGGAGPKAPPVPLPWYRYYLPRIRFFVMLAVALVFLYWLMWKAATTPHPNDPLDPLADPMAPPTNSTPAPGGAD